MPLLRSRSALLTAATASRRNYSTRSRGSDYANSSGSQQGVSAISYPPSSSAGSARRNNRGYSRRTNSAAMFPPPWCCIPRRSSERNLISALCSLIAAALLVAALADNNWFSVSGGRCQRAYLGPPLFFQPNGFRVVQLTDDPVHVTHYRYYYGKHKPLLDCVDPSSANGFYTLIGLSLATIAVDLFAFLLDAIGAKHGFPRWLRRRTVFQLCAVSLCSLLAAVCCYTSWLVEKFQFRTSQHPDMVRVGFARGVYLLFTAGLFSVVSVAYSLASTLREIRRRLSAESDRARLIDTDASGSRRRHRRHHRHRRTPPSGGANASPSSHPDTSTGASTSSTAASTAEFYENYLMGSMDDEMLGDEGQREGDLIPSMAEGGLLRLEATLGEEGDTCGDEQGAEMSGQGTPPPPYAP